MNAFNKDALKVLILLKQKFDITETVRLKLNQKWTRSLLFLLLNIFQCLFIVGLILHSNIACAKNHDAAETRTVHHALGDTVIRGEPKRVVSLFQGATDTLVALGVTPVGAVESWSQKPMYDYLKPQLSDVHYVGLETQPSLEDIALLTPDLIIATRFRNEKTYKILSQIAPTVALEDVYDFRQTLQTVGEAVGREDKAEQLLVDWDNRIEKTRTSLKNKYGSNWPPSVSLLEFRDDHVRAYSPNSFSGAILTDLGFKWPVLVANEQWALQKLVSKESIPLINSDICFYFMREKPTTRQNYQSWTKHPLWAQLSSYQSGQVYQVDSINWNLAGGIISANHVLDDIDSRLLSNSKVGLK